MTNSNSINSVLQSPFNVQFTTKKSKRFAGWGYNSENVYVDDNSEDIVSIKSETLQNVQEFYFMSGSKVSKVEQPTIAQIIEELDSKNIHLIESRPIKSYKNSKIVSLYLKNQGLGHHSKVGALLIDGEVVIVPWFNVTLLNCESSMDNQLSNTVYLK